MAATLVSSAAPALSLRNPNPNPNPSPRRPFLFLRLSPSPLRSKTLTLTLKASSSSSSLAPPPPLLSSSTRTLTTLLSLALSASRALLSRFVAAPQLPFAPMGGPLFFAALRDRPSGYLNTPLTVVAAGMAKWLDIYSGVLMVRVLLSWFPNIPWDRQPLSAIRDLCDPYLNLFRNIIPPVFDTLDVSPLLAFAVLGTLSSILNNSRGMY